MGKQTSDPLSESDRMRLRAARRAAGLSIRTIASRLGISPSTYRRIETGERGCERQLRWHLEALLKVPLTPPPVAAAPTPGARIAAARRAQGLSLRAAAAAVTAAGAPLDRRRLAAIEADQTWLHTAHTLAQVLGIPPEEIGLTSPQTIALPPATAAALVWNLFYRGDTRLLAPLIPIMGHTLRMAPPTIDGGWALQALAVAARDGGQGTTALRLLDSAARQAAALSAPPDLHAALALRRARALADLLPEGPAAAGAWDALAQAQALAGRCTPRLAHVIALTAAPAAAARGARASDWARPLERALQGALRAGGPDPSGVVLTPLGVLHARLDAARNAARCGADSQAPTLLRQVAQELTALGRMPDTPPRWIVGLHISRADAWLTLHDPDRALEALAAAAADLPSLGSAKLTRRLMDIAARMPTPSLQQDAHDLLGLPTAAGGSGPWTAAADEDES